MCTVTFPSPLDCLAARSSTCYTAWNLVFAVYAIDNLPINQLKLYNVFGATAGMLYYILTFITYCRETRRRRTARLPRRAEEHDIVETEISLEEAAAAQKVEIPELVLTCYWFALVCGYICLIAIIVIVPRSFGHVAGVFFVLGLLTIPEMLRQTVAHPDHRSAVLALSVSYFFAFLFALFYGLFGVSNLPEQQLKVFNKYVGYSASAGGLCFFIMWRMELRRRYTEGVEWDIQ